MPSNMIRPAHRFAKPTHKISVDTEAGLLWSDWYDGQNYHDPRALTTSQQAAYFRNGTPETQVRQVGGQESVWNASSYGTSSFWSFGIRVTGSTRLLVLMDLDIYTDQTVGTSKFLVEIDGVPATARFEEASLTYAGLGPSALLVEFTDTDTHDVRVHSQAGLIYWVSDSGSTMEPIPETTLVSNDPRVFVVSDSWGEDRAYGGGAAGPVSALQIRRTDWNLAYNCQGGTGYTNAGNPSFQEVFGGSNRVGAAAGFTPDVVLFYGSDNDAGATTGSVETAAASAFSDIATALPGVPVIVMAGLTATPTDPWIGELESAANNAGNCIRFYDPNVDGWLVDGMTGPDDYGHPNPVGCEHLSALIERVVSETMQAFGDLRF